jgi:hypothetical protein
LGVDPELGQAVRERFAGLVIARNADEPHARPERREVHGSIARATGGVEGSVDIEDRDRAFAAQPLSTPLPAPVEQHVSHHEDGRALTAQRIDQA